MNLELNKVEVDGVIKDLYKLSDKYLEGKVRRKIGREAAKPVIKAVRAKTPKSKRPHRRFNAGGDLVATYYPGNLRRSYKILFNRRTMTLIGHKVGASNKSKHYKGSITDGYYYHMVNNGTVRMAGVGHIDKGWAQSKKYAQSIMINRTLEAVDRFKRGHGF